MEKKTRFSEKKASLQRVAPGCSPWRGLTDKNSLTRTRIHEDLMESSVPGRGPGRCRGPARCAESPQSRQTPCSRSKTEQASAGAGTKASAGAKSLVLGFAVPWASTKATHRRQKAGNQRRQGPCCLHCSLACSRYGTREAVEMPAAPSVQRCEVRTRCVAGSLAARSLRRSRSGRIDSESDTD